MLPHHIVRYITVAAAIYVTAMYFLKLQPNDAFTLAGVAIASLYLADHYAYYSWMKRQLYGGNLFYNDANDRVSAEQYPIQLQYPANSPPVQYFQPQQQLDNNYTAPPAEVRVDARHDPRQKNIAQLYQYRDNCM